MTTETDKTKAFVYEVAFHIVPTVSPENLPVEFDAVKTILGKGGAEIISEEFPKLRPLAYTMIKAVGAARHRCDSAYFGWVKFEGTSDIVAELNKVLGASEKILRHLVVKTVRENTIYGPKILPEEKREAMRVEAVKEAKVAAPISEEELDKSIDKLVV